MILTSALAPYKPASKLARTAALIRSSQGGARGCRLPALTLMSDPREPDIARLAQALPEGSAVIYRHFGAPDKAARAAALRQICFSRGHVLLIGEDAALALSCGADGLHLPERKMSEAHIWRARVSEWIITAAVHDGAAIEKANALPLDAVILSPVFQSNSPSAGAPLGLKAFTELARASRHPVIALGGITQRRAPALIGFGAAGLAGVSFLLPRT